MPVLGCWVMSTPEGAVDVKYFSCEPHVNVFVFEKEGKLYSNVSANVRVHSILYSGEEFQKALE